ncbi:metallophosphoesterase family protein [Thermaerobacter litoralis]
MKVAVISDVHGNGPALEAVLADIAARGVDAVYCLGDVAFQGPHAAHCVDVLRQREIPTVRGNTDRYLAGGGLPPGLSEERAAALLRPWRDALGSQRLEWLQSRPDRLEVRWGPVTALLVHGSPRSDEEPLLPFAPGAGGSQGGGDASDSRSDPLEGVTADVVLFGHHHLQLAWRWARTGPWMVGPGSVGMPFDGDPRAAYALIAVGEGPGAAVDITLVRVPYDVEAVVAAHRQAGLLEYNPLYPAQLRQARMQPEG